MTTNTLMGYIRALNYGKPFYAADLELNGGTIAAMACYNYIRRTGNTKEYMVNLYDDVYKKVSVYEWELVISKDVHYNDWRKNQIDREYNKAKAFVNAYEGLKAAGKW